MKEEMKKKSFDFASDTTKQLITLSTVLIALSVTFKGNFNGGGCKFLLLLCWVSFFISVLLGIVTLLALTGKLDEISSAENTEGLGIYNKNIKIPSLIQISCFLCGLLFLSIYGVQSIYTDEKKTDSNKIDIEKKSNKTEPLGTPDTSTIDSSR